MSETQDAAVTVDPSPDEAAWVLHRFGHARSEVARMPPRFYSDLLDAMRSADAWNMERLSAGFPGLVTAYRWMTSDLGGVDRLTAIARGAR